jgi:uncharacterized membrane protein
MRTKLHILVTVIAIASLMYIILLPVNDAVVILLAGLNLTACSYAIAYDCITELKLNVPHGTITTKECS